MQFKDVTDALLRRVPAFAKARSSDPSFLSYDDDSPYLVFGDFGLFIREYLKVIDTPMKDDTFLKQSFELLNEMLTSTDPEVQNLAVVGVFETLTDAPEAFTMAKKNLTSDAQKEVERWL